MNPPATIFTIWSPDSVAECMDGVSDDMYKRLWELTAHVPRLSADDETPDSQFKQALSTVWHLLTPAEQAELNFLAVQHEAREDAIFNQP